MVQFETLKKGKRNEREYTSIWISPMISVPLGIRCHHEDFPDMLALVGRKYPEIGLFKDTENTTANYRGH